MVKTRNHGVLFICLGNICRSPTAEGLFRSLVTDHGVEELYDIDSAGTISYHAGERPDRRMRQAASRRGYELRGRSRQIQESDFDRFDLIVPMDRSNLADLEALGHHRSGQLRLLSEFLPAGSPVDVPDPYYGGDGGFDEVLDMIEQACPRILESLTSGRH